MQGGKPNKPCHVGFMKLGPLDAQAAKPLAARSGKPSADRMSLIERAKYQKHGERFTKTWACVHQKISMTSKHGGTRF